MKIRPADEIKNLPPEYEEDGKSEEIEGTVADESDGASEETDSDKNEGDDHSDDESDDFTESYYSDNSDDYDDELFKENVDSESEWFRQEFESQASQLVPNKVRDQESSEEDIIHSEEELKSTNGSDDEKDEHNFPIFNVADQYDPTFKLGMLFGTKKELKQAIDSHAIKSKRSLSITKNDKIRVYAKCANKDCGWKLHALKLNDECTFQIRHYVSDHTCAASSRVKNLTSSWLSTKYVNKFRSDPKRNVKGFRVDVIEDIRCHISNWQAYKAKKKAITKIEGAAEDQYTLLWDFVDEIKRTNPGSTAIIGTDDSSSENRFDRFYLCLYALKAGFLACCRPFVGVDGCHLKGPHGGVLLSAVGVDPNNNNFPIAFAVVNTESRDTWEWFLCLLKLDLKIEKDYEWTFMSDKHKGLIQAFNEVLPNADHRFCVRHLHSNFKSAGFRGEAFKMALWNCARATTVNDFGRKMNELKEIDEKAVEWLNDKPPAQWSMSHFTDFSRCDMLLNNGCESFNSNILEARDKPILSMMEWILEYLMKRMQINRDRAENRWGGSLCPKIQKIINKTFDKIGDYIPIKADDFHYQISGFDGTQYCVDLKKGTCGCRKWELSGIPCRHALSVIHAQDYDYYNYTEKCYRLDTYKLVYAFAIMPINGRNEWKHTNIIPPLPPNPGRPAGRPKKARKRERDEGEQEKNKKFKGKAKVLSTENRMKRQKRTLRCSQCGVTGHNKKSCTIGPIQPDEVNASLDQPLSQLTQELGSQRPTKLQVRRNVSFEEDEGDNTTPRSHINIGKAAKQNKKGEHDQTLRVAPPSMFDQYNQCQTRTSMVNLRAPAPFVGGCFIPSIERCITRSCSTFKSIISEGGKKFLDLSSLPSTRSEIRDGTWKSKEKGKGEGR